MNAPTVHVIPWNSYVYYRDGYQLMEGNRQRIAEMRRAAELFCEVSFPTIPAMLADVATRLEALAAELGETAAHLDRNGMTAPMIAEGVRNVVAPWKDERCNAAFRSMERGDGIIEPVLPKVVFANFAGNLFVSAWETVFQAWLMGSAVFARLPAGNDCLLPLLSKVAGEVWSLLPELITWDHWPAHEHEQTRDVILCCDAAVVFGGDEAVEALAGLIPWDMPRRLHGGANSFVVVNELDVTPTLARGVAYDVCVYDQSGCLNPRLILFVGSWDAAMAFANLLKDNMAGLEECLPRRRLDLADRATVARDRDNTLLQAALGGSACVVSANEDPFLVTVNEGGVNWDFLPKSARHACVVVVPDNESSFALLARYRGRISTIGISWDTLERFRQILDLKASRVCEPGWMQLPGQHWANNGQRPLASLLRWRTVY